MQKYVADRVSSVWTSFTELGQIVDQVTKYYGEAPPGYLLHELAKTTHKSWDDSRKVQDLLQKKLVIDSPNVKLKTLKTFRFIVERGHESFAADLRRCVSPIQDCLSFHGPPDPLTGNAPYREVHEEAEIILALLYKPTENNAQVSAIGSEGGGSEGGVPLPHSASDGIRSMSSEGSTANSQFIREKTDERGEVRAVGYNPNTPTPNTPGVGPTGFGNYMGPPPGDESAGDLTKKLLELAGHEIKRGAVNVGSVVKTKANEYDYYGVLSYVGLKPEDTSGYQKSTGAPTQGGGAPVGWGNDGSQGGPSGGVITAQGGGGSSYSNYYKPQQAPTPPSRVAPGSASAPSMSTRKERNAKRTPALLTPTISADSDASTEEKFVKDLTALGGVVKTTLPPAILVSFSDRFPDLDQQMVVRLVLQRLKAPQWQVRLKGLMVLEEVVKLSENFETKAELHALIATSPSFRDSLESPHRSVRTKANAVFLQLEEEARALPVVEEEPEEESESEEEDEESSVVSEEEESANAEREKETGDAEGLFGSVQQQAPPPEPLIDLLGPSGPSDFFPTSSAPQNGEAGNTTPASHWFDSLLNPTPAPIPASVSEPTPTSSGLLPTTSSTPTAIPTPTPTPPPTPASTTPLPATQDPFDVFIKPQSQPQAPQPVEDDFFSFIK